LTNLAVCWNCVAKSQKRKNTLFLEKRTFCFKLLKYALNSFYIFS
jgi:hypothetical protein